jgi:hypothetical protein
MTLTPAQTFWLKVHLCLLACAFHWLPLSVLDRIVGKVIRLGWTGSIAYSLLIVVLCLLVLSPSEKHRI